MGHQPLTSDNPADLATFPAFCGGTTLMNAPLKLPAAVRTWRITLAAVADEGREIEIVSPP